MLKIVNLPNSILENIANLLTSQIQDILEQKTISKDRNWQKAINQSKVMDRILAHMVQTSYPNKDWTKILPKIKQISPSSVAVIAENLENNQNIASLLKELSLEFAPLTLSRCYDIAMSNGNITLAEQEILSQMAMEFNLDLSAVSGE